MSLNVSDKWKQDTQKKFRHQGYLDIRVSLESPGIRDGAVVSALNTEGHIFSNNLQSLTDGETPVYPRMATCEPMRWALDGTFDLYSSNPAENPPQPWWSNTLNSTPTFVFTFDSEYSLPGMVCTWDTATNSWATSITVVGYNLQGQQIGVYELDEVPSKPSYFVNTPFEQCAKITLTVNAWSRSDWYVRVSEIFFGVLVDFPTNEILKAHYTSIADPTTSVPCSISAEVFIDNIHRTFDPFMVEGLSKYIVPKQFVEWRWGFLLSDATVEQAPTQSLFIKEVQLPSTDNALQLTLGTQLDFLNNTFSKGTYSSTPRSLGECAQYILEKVSLLKRSAQETPYEIPVEMFSMYTSAPILKDSISNLLQLISGASGRMLCVDPITGYIKFNTWGEVELVNSLTRTVTRSEQTSEPDIIIDEELYKVTVGIHTYVLKDTTESIHKSTYLLNEPTMLHLDFSPSADTTISILGGNISSSAIYVSSADVLVTPDSPATEVSVEVLGRSIDEQVAYITTYQNPNITKGLEIVIDNPFITNTNNLSTITNVIKDFYSRKQDIVFSSFGYPELIAGSSIRFETPQGVAEGPILENTIDYSGGWSSRIATRLGNSIN